MAALRRFDYHLPMNPQTHPIVLAVTGASGAPYAVRLLETLIRQDIPVSLLLSDAARVVLKTECDWVLPDDPAGTSQALQSRWAERATLITPYGLRDWFAPPASGSAPSRGMVVCPCSMGTLSAIAHGASDTLIERAADVHIKEKRPLILVPRETPLSPIHLGNMLRLAELGVRIVPAMPGFYHHPQGIDDLINFVVARILQSLALPQTLVPAWGEPS